MEKLCETVALFASGIFTGAAVYITLVEHPARMECGTKLAATEFGPSYRRAAVMQASLAAIGFIAATAAWLMGASAWWLVGGLLLGSVIPFTLIAIMPTNTELKTPDLDKESERTLHLLTKWGRLHAVRSLLSWIAFLIFLAI
jgi:Anthrone oxygenase